MFGPLNNVRIALVIAAGLAGLLAIVLGFPGAGFLLLAGVGIHGLGWFYLYGKRSKKSPDRS